MLVEEEETLEAALGRPVTPRWLASALEEMTPALAAAGIGCRRLGLDPRTRRQMLLASSLWEDHDLVFCQANGRPIDSRADWQEWSDILTTAGLPHHGVHAMRHSAATIALDEGIALAVVQEMLGHSDIRVTRGYTHVGSPLAQDAAQRMGQALFGEPA